MQLHFERGRPDDLKTLHPAYFALVLATGIVAIATYLHDVPVVPIVLFWLNVVFLVARHFAVWLTRNQLQTCRQMRIPDELGRRERYSLYRLDTLLPKAVQSRILGSGPKLVGRSE
jgi:hypothetical protein